MDEEVQIKRRKLRAVARDYKGLREENRRLRRLLERDGR